MFCSATAIVRGRLNDMCAAVEQQMRTRIQAIFQDVYRDYLTVLVGGTPNNPQRRMPREERQLRGRVTSILQTVDDEIAFLEANEDPLGACDGLPTVESQIQAELREEEEHQKGEDDWPNEDVPNDDAPNDDAPNDDVPNDDAPNDGVSNDDEHCPAADARDGDQDPFEDESAQAETSTLFEGEDNVGTDRASRSPKQEPALSPAGQDRYDDDDDDDIPSFEEVFLARFPRG